MTSVYAAATYTSAEMRTITDSTLADIIARPIPMSFNGLKHTNKAVYMRTIADEFQFNCDELFHIADFTDSHGDPPVIPTYIRLILPYKTKLLFKSVYWILYVKGAIKGDLVSIICVDSNAGINDLVLPDPEYQAIDYGEPLMFMIVAPGESSDQNHYYIRQISSGLPHPALTGTLGVSATNNYPNYTVHGHEFASINMFTSDDTSGFELVVGIAGSLSATTTAPSPGSQFYVRSFVFPCYATITKMCHFCNNIDRISSGPPLTNTVTVRKNWVNTTMTCAYTGDGVPSDFPIACTSENPVTCIPGDVVDLLFDCASDLTTPRYAFTMVFRIDTPPT